jgi:hypothetical protein
VSCGGPPPPLSGYGATAFAWLAEPYAFALRATADEKLACQPKLREAERRLVPEGGFEPPTPRL